MFCLSTKCFFFPSFLEMFGSILLFGTRGQQSTRYVGSQFAHKLVIKVILTYDVMLSFWETFQPFHLALMDDYVVSMTSLKLLYLLHLCYFHIDIALSTNLFRASSFLFISQCLFAFCSDYLSVSFTYLYAHFHKDTSQ